MNTPYKSANAVDSPYAQPAGLYPSQAEDFLPLQLGGPGAAPTTTTNNTPHKNHLFTSTPSKQARRGMGGCNAGFKGFSPRYSPCSGNYQQRQYQSWRGAPGRIEFQPGTEQVGGQVGHENSNYYQNRGYGRSGGYDSRFGNQHKHQHRVRQDSDNILQYLHASMFEDPWQELEQRQQALNGNQSGTDTTSEEEGSSEGETSEDVDENDLEENENASISEGNLEDSIEKD